MPELRWTLALLGVAFLVGLAWWELRRPRQARRGELSAPAPRESPQGPARELAATGETLVLPQMRAREPAPTLPTVQLDDDALGLEAEHEIELDREHPRLEEPRLDAAGLEEAAREEGALEEPFEEPALDAAAHADAAPAAVGQVPEMLLRGSVAPPAAPLDPIVEWPEESMRRVVALRLVAPGDRFAGRAVRQALAAEGFVLGKFAIFHRSGPDGRAVVSAASLNKPGTFDRDSIDMQRFAGLNLFVVLPGPLAPARAFDELLIAARNLNERLQGALQDERGEPLTPLRAAALREALLDAASGPTARAS